MFKICVVCAYLTVASVTIQLMATDLAGKDDQKAINDRRFVKRGLAFPETPTSGDPTYDFPEDLDVNITVVYPNISVNLTVLSSTGRQQAPEMSSVEIAVFFDTKLENVLQSKGLEEVDIYDFILTLMHGVRVNRASDHNYQSVSVPKPEVYVLARYLAFWCTLFAQTLYMIVT